jgi:membrane-bound metal-dependent hydrolase YbcI (DUF457 family)
MLPSGHTSISYLIAQIPSKQKTVLTWKEVLLVLIAGNIYDFDYYVPVLFGFPIGTHHFFFTHTPLMGVIYFLLFYLIFRKKISKKTFVCIALALLSHMVLDDLSYWMGLLGLEARSWPQIYWLYPFDSRLEFWKNRFKESFSLKPYSTSEVYRSYFERLPKLFYLELTFSFWALIVFVRKNYRRIIGLVKRKR